MLNLMSCLSLLKSSSTQYSMEFSIIFSCSPLTRESLGSQTFEIDESVLGEDDVNWFSVFMGGILSVYCIQNKWKLEKAIFTARLSTILFLRSSIDSLLFVHSNNIRIIGLLEQFCLHWCHLIIAFNGVQTNGLQGVNSTEPFV